MSDEAPADSSKPVPYGLDAQNAWTYLLPMAVYMVLGQVLALPEPDPAGLDEAGIFGLTHEHYPIVYAAQIAITGVAFWLCRAGWSRLPKWGDRFPRISPLAIVVGVVGVVLWVACCELGLEAKLVEAVGGPESPAMWVLGPLGFGAERAAFNPLDGIESPAARALFLAVRFTGLALLVPLFEELFLRGWLMRTVISANLSQVAFGRVTRTSVIVGTAFPMLYHPEKVASLVWFSLVTWLMVRTKNYWDCVTAHAVTNLLLGLYVLYAGAWHLW